jgi:hypothetical protein
MHQCGVDMRRWRRAVVAGWGGVDQRRARWRRREERLVGGWSGPQDAGVRGPRYRHGVGVDDSGPGMLSRGPGRRRHGLLRWRWVAVALAVVAATTVSTRASAVAARGRRSGRARSPPAVGKDAISAGPKGSGRLLGRVVGSHGARWKTRRRRRKRTGGEASDKDGVSRKSPDVFQPPLLVAKVGHSLLVCRRGEQREVGGGVADVLA